MTRWICSQIGAREHYAIPRALHTIGRLQRLFTDFWATESIRHLKFGKLRSLAARHHPELPDSLVSSFNIRALLWETQLRHQEKSGGATEKYHGFVDVAQRFASSVRTAVARLPLDPAQTIFFGYDTGCLETFAWMHDRDIPCVLDQMDPAQVEANLMREEERKWPGWSRGPMSIPDEYYQRRRQEWNRADRIVVNSEFCRRALVEQGVSASKISVIPLCYEAPYTPARGTTHSGRPLRALFLGQVILRKGIQYLMEAARLLAREPVVFDVVGHLGISTEAIRSAPSNMSFHGRASRDQIGSWYQQSDIFLLPTLSDGFAVTQIEAMAHGLPVITTPCCGDVVTHGADGFIVPPAEPGLFADAVSRYIGNPDLHSAHSLAAREKSRQFGFDRLIVNLLSLEAELLPSRRH